MQKPDQSAIEVDFRRRETEGGWSAGIDRLGLAAAPVWFTWLEWILILGGLEYLAGKSGAIFARLTAGVSIALLWFYFNGFFSRFHFKGWFRIQSPAIERILSITASSIIAAVFWWIAQSVAQTIAANTK